MLPRRGHRPAAARTVTAAALSALALAAALLPATSATAEALPLSPTDQTAHDRLAIRSNISELGPDLAGVVVDAETGQEIWSRTPTERQIPASTVKIITAEPDDIQSCFQ